MSRSPAYGLYVRVPTPRYRSAYCHNAAGSLMSMRRIGVSLPTAVRRPERSAVSPSPRVIGAALGGPLPAYIYDLGTVRDRIAALRAALPERTRVAYAMKANGHPAVVAAAARAAG